MSRCQLPWSKQWVTVYGRLGMKEYFTKEKDPHIDFDKVEPLALNMLNRAREKAEIPFVITSTYRSPDYSESQGWSRTNAHTEEPCAAFDIACTGARERYLIIKALLDVGFDRIGFNANHVHVDRSMNLDQEVFWLE